MFWPDVIVLKQFYASPLGQLAARMIRRGIDRCWSGSVAGETILGVGYTGLYLEPYIENAERVIALMPLEQGAMHWPNQLKNMTFLSDEAEIPLPDESVSRVLMVHSCENSEQLRHMMHEVWRILAPGGRILVVAPNRRGAWARAPHSPFAHGSSFSNSQLKAMLREQRFTPYESHYLLFTPPIRHDLCLKANWVFEWIGSRFFKIISGLILMEAEKQLFAVNGPATAKQRRREIYIPATQPAMTRDGI